MELNWRVHTERYNGTFCVMKYVASDDGMASKRLMMNFEKFEISDHAVELKISGAAGGDVS